MSNQDNVRKAQLGIWIGTTGTRKTSNIKKLLQANARNLIIPADRDDDAWHGYPELKPRGEYYNDPLDPNPANKKRRIVIDGLATFKGNAVLHVDGNPLIFDAVADATTGYRNGGLVCDDYRNYFLAKGSLKSNVERMFRNMRRRMLDVWMAGHSWEDVPRDLMKFNPKLFIHYTTLPPTESSLDKMANADAFLAAVERVQRINQPFPETERWRFELFHPDSLDAVSINE